MPLMCAICGVHPSTSKDHIPPKNLYPKPRDNDINLNTVPACGYCNNGSSSDDEVFKILVGIETGEHQKDPQKIIDSLAATVAKNARVANQVFSTKQRVLASIDSSVLQPAVTVSFDFEPYARVITRIVRGLHWMETGRTLVSAAKVQVLPGNHLSQSVAADWMGLMQLLTLKKLNKDSFSYRCHIGEDGLHAWGMQFFSRHTAFALVQEQSTQR